MAVLVSDAKRSLVFEITLQDVKVAKRHNKRLCVIASALRAVPGIQEVLVGTNVVRVRSEGKIWRYATPGILSKALAKFDASGYWLLPAGVYTLKPPPRWLSKEVIGKRFKTRHKASGRPINKKTGRRYKETGTKRSRQVNPRVLMFAKIKKAAKA